MFVEEARKPLRLSRKSVPFTEKIFRLAMERSNAFTEICIASGATRIVARCACCQLTNPNYST